MPGRKIRVVPVVELSLQTFMGTRTMRFNAYRGTVADRPIDSQVIQDAPQRTLLDRIAAMSPQVDRVEAVERPPYNKG
jgi:hypothetical protein